MSSQDNLPHLFNVLHPITYRVNSLLCYLNYSSDTFVLRLEHNDTKSFHKNIRTTNKF